jgi:polyisoprenoid-binding protein YceI
MTSRKLRLGLAALASLAVLALAQFGVTRAAAQSYRIAPERTLAGFAVTNLGVVRQDGHFNRASGTIVLDPARASGGSVDVTIDLSSVDTGWDTRDDFLRGESMFDVARYPVLHFRSTRVVYREGHVVAAEGEVTMHGVTKPLKLEVQRLECGRVSTDGHESCLATVAGQLRRRDFGMEAGYPIVGDVITLDFAITAVRASAEPAPQ